MRPLPSPRSLSMSPSGRFVAIGQGDRIALVDALGPAPRRSLHVPGLVDHAWVGARLWVVAAGDAGCRLRCHELADPGQGRELDGDEGVDLPGQRAGRLLPDAAGDADSALWLGERPLLVRAAAPGAVPVRDVRASAAMAGPSPAAPGAVTVRDLSAIAGGDRCVGLVAGGRLVVAGAGTLALHPVAGPPREPPVRIALPAPGEAVACHALFGGRALAVLMDVGDAGCFLVMRPDGALVHRVAVPRPGAWAVAGACGRALVLDADADALVSVDLRYGKVLARVAPPIPIHALAMDADGRYVALAGHAAGEPGAAQAPVLHGSHARLFGGAGALARLDLPSGAGARPDEDAPPGAADAASGEPLSGAARAPAAPEPIEIPAGPLRALGRVVPPPRPGRPRPGRARGGPVRPYTSAEAHLADLLDLAEARVRRAIARAWDTGELSAPDRDGLPFARVVAGLAGRTEGRARQVLDEADAALAAIVERTGQRMVASRAAGHALPLATLGEELGLSTLESQVLVTAAAPALRGEIARLYRILANDPRRAVCDCYLIEQILGDDDSAQRRIAIGRALTPDARLARHGLIDLGAPASPADPGEARGSAVFAPVTVDPVLLDRLAGRPRAGTGPGAATELRQADRGLEALHLPAALARALVLALAEPPRDGHPVRVLLRGRVGSGRRSLGAALAARVGRPLAVIHCERLPRRGRAFAVALRRELCRAVIRGAVACVSGLEVLDRDDAEALEHVRAVLRAHPAPILVRAGLALVPPLAPGYLSFVIPPLSESERLGFLHEALARRGMPAGGAAPIASRYRFGAGTLETIVSAAQDAMAAQDAGVAQDVGQALDTAARQHIETRMGKVATRITRLARWDQVALPEEVLTGVHEIVARMRHRRTVYERWGFDSRMHTTRGLTALFYGPPGVGKTMVAGVIARELGMDLYRVDLAQVTSKWLGETEKNLAEVFDAAEDGQALILFDEADSLFSKRTKAETSTDRYANLEVDYLLQRLDGFEGVAILTTNREGAIDKAFRRRLSLQIAFPFPDEDMRERLWAAHLPEDMPRAGTFDLAWLARQYPLSGGYIRNCALRAAFLAADQGVALTQQHLIRAVELEYREMGKLAPGGRME